MEDQWLKLRFKAGSQEALRRIYEKYRDRLLTVAMALLNDRHGAEDVVQDVFVAFAQSRGRFELHGRLKSYLTVCVANRAKDRLRSRKRRPDSLDAAAPLESGFKGPADRMIATEHARLIGGALAQLPFEQREVVALRLNGAMTFREIARDLDISIGTAKGRYRYGLDKLRSILNGRLE